MIDLNDSNIFTSNFFVILQTSLYSYHTNDNGELFEYGRCLHGLIDGLRWSFSTVAAADNGFRLSG